MDWFKFYGKEFLSDPKMLSLTAIEKGLWLTILCLASSSEEQGVIKYITEEKIKILAGISFTDEEWSINEGFLNKFAGLGMITIDNGNDNGMITVINWEKRQNKALTPYERVKRHRERLKLQDNSFESNDNEMITGDNGDDNKRVEKKREEKRNKLNIGKLEEVVTSSEELKDEDLPNGMSTLKSVLQEKFILPPKEPSGITTAFQEKALRMAKELGITLTPEYRSRWIKVFKDEEGGKKSIWSTQRAYSYLKDYLPSEGRDYSNENKIKHFFWLIANGNTDQSP